jgi:hypothetical protein
MEQNKQLRFQNPEYTRYLKCVIASDPNIKLFNTDPGPFPGHLWLGIAKIWCRNFFYNSVYSGG